MPFLYFRPHWKVIGALPSCTSGVLGTSPAYFSYGLSDDILPPNSFENYHHLSSFTTRSVPRVENLRGKICCLTYLRILVISHWPLVRCETLMHSVGLFNKWYALNCDVSSVCSICAKLSPTTQSSNHPIIHSPRYPPQSSPLDWPWVSGNRFSDILIFCPHAAARWLCSQPRPPVVSDPCDPYGPWSTARFFIITIKSNLLVDRSFGPKKMCHVLNQQPGPVAFFSDRFMMKY